MLPRDLLFVLSMPIYYTALWAFATETYVRFSVEAAPQAPAADKVKPLGEPAAPAPEAVVPVVEEAAAAGLVFCMFVYRLTNLSFSRSHNVGCKVSTLMTSFMPLLHPLHLSRSICFTFSLSFCVSLFILHCVLL